MPETTNDSYEVENDNNDSRDGLKSKEGGKNSIGNIKWATIAIQADHHTIIIYHLTNSLFVIQAIPLFLILYFRYGDQIRT